MIERLTVDVEVDAVVPVLSRLIGDQTSVDCRVVESSRSDAKRRRSVCHVHISPRLYSDHTAQSRYTSILIGHTTLTTRLDKTKKHLRKYQTCYS